MTTVQRPSNPTPLARRVREQFVADMQVVLAALADAIRARLIELVDASPSTREMQDRRDAMLDFDRLRASWIENTQKAWRQAVVPATATARVRMASASLELIGDDVVEKKIISSRLALAIQEKAAFELNDLRLRMQHLEGGTELATEDILRPEALAQLMVEQWGVSQLSRETWALVKDLIQDQVVTAALAAYHRVNELLIGKGILPDIDFSSKVKRGASPPGAPRKAPGGAEGEGGNDAQQGTGNDGGRTGSSRFGTTGHGNGRGSGVSTGGGGWSGGGENGNESGGGDAYERGGGGGGGSGGGSGPSGRGGSGGGGGYRPDAEGGGGGSQGGGGRGGSHGGGYSGPGQQGGGRGGAHAGGQPGAMQGGGVADETRLMTTGTPLARARQRANGVLGQLRRLLTDRVAGFDMSHETRPSPALAEALSQQASQVQAGDTGGGTVREDVVVYDDARVEQVAVQLRQRTGELKKKASTSTEKATIEIVALMFQSILAEERIPPAVRVWFARLQMPVLRVALSEPEFFGTLQHPARQLIDRMGSCVMGFEASAIGGSALEVEIKRVVQVIEQYPETGRRVFQLVYDEFQKFLSRFLTEKGPTQRLVSVAQQVEQKETMAIQYTIEMRNMLNDMPVREEIREFLFKVWAEVLAVAAVKNGPQHEETVALKKSASDLVWAASAKPNRNDRAKVIQDLPKLLHRLRQGMALMGVTGSAQEAHIKIIGDTLADAFLSKTEAIPHEQIEAMAKRLAHLEDFVADDPATDLPLDAESIELMLGIDASMIEVVADGGSKPNAAMIAWAQELQLGNWFSLDHNNKINHVQYVWRSERKQLHLFASPDGKSFLVQARRLAAYLQAGLLLPQEEETLTVRATRDALAKLDANPERLLQ
ncbi:MAG: DUF1631 domain-containing protein [Burkholderiales bacterium]|nr:DUF1631 domain-containing protein [Burkholderiales bacterium]